MHILRLGLSNFGKFAHLEVEFGPGLNLVRGPNEAGKTTLQRAVSLALLGRPTGKKAEKKDQAWGAERMYQLKIACRMADGREVEVVKDYESKAHEVRSAEGADTSRQAQEEFVQEALGTQSLKVFESTACVDQDAMGHLEAGRPEMSRQLQSILAGGGDVSLDQAIAKLERRIGDLEKGWRTHAPVSPGPIGVLLQRIGQLDEDLAQARNEVSRTETARERLGEIRTRLDEIRSDLDPKMAALDLHKERTAAKQRLEGLAQEERELEERLGRLQEAERQRQEALDAIASFPSLQGLQEVDRGHLRELRQNVLLAEGKEKSRADDLARLEGRLAQAKPGQPRRKVAALIVTGAGLIIAVLGIVLLVAQGQPWMDYLGGAGACAGVMLLMAGVAWLALSVLRKPEDVQARVDEARRLQEDAGREAARLRAELTEKIQALGCDSWDQFEQRLTHMDSLTWQVSEAAARSEGLLREGETIESLEAERKEVSRERRDAEEKIAEFAGVPDLDLVTYERLGGEVVAQQDEQRSLEEERLGLQGMVKAGTSGLEDLLGLQEEKAALEQELQRLQSWHGVYTLALQVMREARTGAMRTARDELAPRMAAYLERLTVGRYSQVQVDESLEPALVHPSKGAGPIETDEMSQGTLDQVFLAARLALCDFLFGDALPPLLMDDPFVKFDPQRREAALALCRELAKDRQIILFTCHEGYDEYADKVIDLAALG